MLIKSASLISYQYIIQGDYFNALKTLSYPFCLYILYIKKKIYIKFMKLSCAFILACTHGVLLGFNGHCLTRGAN